MCIPNQLIVIAVGDSPFYLPDMLPWLGVVMKPCISPIILCYKELKIPSCTYQTCCAGWVWWLTRHAAQAGCCDLPNMLPGLGVVRGPSPPPSGSPLAPPPVCPPSHIAPPAAATPSDIEGEAPRLCYCLRWLPHSHSNWKICVFKICRTNTVQREIFSLILFFPLSLQLSTGQYKTGRIQKSQLPLF